MKITNKTKVNLEIMTRILKPNESGYYPEKQFNILHVHSEVGSCIITSEYGERRFKSYGKLYAKGYGKDNKGNIIIVAIN